ncbi:MAG: sensor histidine kinase [Rectinemataceae bacterium]
MSDPGSRDELLIENRTLRLRLEEAEATLRAIGEGEVDAFVVSGEEGERVFTLTDADTPYRVLVETMNEGAVSLGPDGTILYCNSCLAGLLEVPLEKLIGTKVSSYVVPEDREYFSLRIAGPSGQKREEGISLLTTSGGSLPVLFSFGMLGRDLAAGLGVVFTDLSGINMAEAGLRREKDRLVELLHRIKNTLAQIDAIARTEASLSADPGISEALIVFADRVGALSGLFTMLDSEGKPGRVRLDLYLADVATRLVGATKGGSPGLSLKFNLEPVTMDGKQAANMGLILNELITNAVKYSFSGKGRGEISLDIKQEADRITLSVSNDGAELPKDFDPSLSKGLGMSIVAGLAQQMGGRLSWTGGKGARFQVDIPAMKESVIAF